MSLIPDPGNYDSEAVMKVVYSLGIPFLVLWLVITPLLLLWIIKGCGRAGKYDRYFIRKTPIAIAVGVLWVLVEFFQIIWFTFIAERDWPGFNFSVFLNAFQLNFPLSWFAWFWIFSGYALLVLTIVLIFTCCCGDMSEEAFIVVGCIFMSMIPIFQPLMIKMMEALVCTYPIGSPATLDVFPEFVCWEGTHVLYATVAIIVIVVFYPAISITMAVMVGGTNDRTVWIAFFILQFKMVQVFFYAFFHTFILAYLLCLLGVNASFLLLSIWLPHSHPILSLLRKIAMSMALWCVIPSLVAFAINDPNDWTGVGLLIGGWVIIPIIVVVVDHFLQKRRAKAEPSIPLGQTPPPQDPSGQPGQQPPIPQQATTEIYISQGNQQGYPPQGYPPQGYPPQGYPPQGYPPQGYLPQGWPAGQYEPQPAYPIYDD